MQFKLYASCFFLFLPMHLMKVGIQGTETAENEIVNKRKRKTAGKQTSKQAIYIGTRTMHDRKGVAMGMGGHLGRLIISGNQR